jgi:glutamate synthase (NADPH/NADH) small chain
LTRSFGKGKKRALKGSFADVDWHYDRVSRKFEMKERPGSDFTMEFDLVLLAMGFVHPVQTGIIESLGLEKAGFGTIAVDTNYQTSIEKVFAAGDAVSGASLVVRAIRQGREAADRMDKWL